VNRAVEIDQVLPLNYFKSFKASWMYLKSVYPEWDIDEFRDKLWHAEQYWNIIKFEDNYLKDQHYEDF
jgi:hypothetical protein